MAKRERERERKSKKSNREGAVVHRNRTTALVYKYSYTHKT